MQDPYGVMVWVAENIQACLRIFRRAAASMARKRHLASTARGFSCFCLMARIGVQGVQEVQEVQGVQKVQEVQMVQMVQEVQGVQMVQDVQKVQGVQLRPICILRARMKDSLCWLSIHDAVGFFTYRYIFSESFYLYPMVNSQKGSIFAVQKIKGTIFPF